MISKTQNYSVRVAEVEDIPEVAGLWLKMVKEIYPDNAPRIDWWIEICQAMMATGRYYVIVVEVDFEIVGFVDGFYWKEPSTGMLHGVGQHMYILPEFRDTLVAMKLYRKIMDIGKSFGVQVWEFFCAQDNQKFWLKKKYKPQSVMMRRM